MPATLLTDHQVRLYMMLSTAFKLALRQGEGLMKGSVALSGSRRQKAGEAVGLASGEAVEAVRIQGGACPSNAATDPAAGTAASRSVALSQ